MFACTYPPIRTRSAFKAISLPLEKSVQSTKPGDKGPAGSPLHHCYPDRAAGLSLTGSRAAGSHVTLGSHVPSLKQADSLLHLNPSLPEPSCTKGQQSTIVTKAPTDLLSSRDQCDLITLQHTDPTVPGLLPISPLDTPFWPGSATSVVFPSLLL